MSEVKARPEKGMRALQRAVDFVTKALAELTDSSLLGVDDEGRDVVRVAPMPNTAIHQAQGLAFILRRKKGALVSVCSERVVLLWKKAQADGSITWSPPVFLRGKTFGAGLTLGFLNMRICLALMNDKGLSAVLRPHHNTALNCTFAVDMNGSRIRPLRTSSAGGATQVHTDRSGGMQARYYLLEACILDVSANGGYFRPDDDVNRALYGEGVDVQDVLACRVAPPPEFQPVYDQLNECIRAVKREHRALTMHHDRSLRGGRAAEVAAEAVREVVAAQSGGRSSASQQASAAPQARGAAPTEAVLAGAAAKLGAKRLSPLRVQAGA